MPPRLHLPRSKQTTRYICPQCRHQVRQQTSPYATLSTSTITTTATSYPTPPSPLSTTVRVPAAIALHLSSQPPSHKPPEFRKSQLHRQYQSLLRSCPVTLIFQHNNLKAVEWMGVRRELAKALRKVDEEMAKARAGSEAAVEGQRQEAVGEGAKLSVVQTGIFASALRVVEFWDPRFEAESISSSPSTTSEPAIAESISTTPAFQQHGDDRSTHGLSILAHKISKKASQRHTHGLEPLLTGPLALLTLPTLNPPHLAAALKILSPSPAFPAPKRRENPGYHDPAVQNGLQKLMLLGARVEGRILDLEGVRIVGGLEGLEGLRAQLVRVLSGVGAGVTGALEGMGRSLYYTVEGRRLDLEQEKGAGDAGGA